MAFCLSSTGYANAKPYWLEEGSYAEYEFGGFIMTYGNLQKTYIQGTIRWECIEMENDFATIEETLSFFFPQTYFRNEQEYDNDIIYLGKEYVDMAKAGDYSFITEFHIDDQTSIESFEPEVLIDPETGEAIIDKDTGQPIMIGRYLVVVSNVDSIIEKRTTIKVDLDTRDVYDMEGNLFGRWLWWINVGEYPLDGNVTELALYNWRGYEVPVGIRYWNMDMELTKQYWDMVFQYMVPEGVYDWFVMSNFDVPGYDDYDPDDPYRISPIIFRDLYDANTGYLIYSEYYGLADDISLNVFDLEAHMGEVRLVGTNINFDAQDTSVDEKTGSTLYYLAFSSLIVLFLISLVVVRTYNPFD